MSLIGDTNVSTETAVVGVMSEYSTSTNSPQVINENPTIKSTESAKVPYSSNNPFQDGGNKTKNKHKTTKRRKNIYFTKEDFISF